MLMRKQRLLGALTLGACALVVLPLACGGASSGSGLLGGGGAPGAGSNTGTGGVGAGASSTGTSGGLNIMADAGPGPSAGSGPLDPDAACGVGAENASLAPLNMFVMFDDSRSMDMNNKWVQATTALKSFFGDPATAGLRAALRLFPNDSPMSGCNQTDCSVPACTAMQVPLAALTAAAAPADTQEAALATALSGNTASGGGTPLSAALAGAEQAAILYQAAHKDEKTVVVLVTDGAPRGCNEDITAIAQLAADAKLSNGLLTYAIGLEGSNESDMDSIALSGGTTKGFFIGTSTNAQSDLLAALSAIRGKNLACDFPMPTAKPGVSVDPSKINVNFTPGGGAQTTLLQVPSQAECAQGDTWYYDNPSNPTRIFLCPHICDAARADASAKLQILLGCATQTDVPK